MDKQKGQYFTISKVLQDITVSYIKKSSGMMLEPSFGRGDLVNCVLNKHKNRKIIAVELDNTIKSIVKDKRVEIHYMNFIDYDHINIFSTIFGNPPYVNKHTESYTNSILNKCNLYLIFIEKCYYHLDTTGEMIMIIPSDFWSNSHGSKLRNMMVENGTFTHVYYPSKENMFDNASQDIIVFRYEKNNMDRKMLYNDKIKYLNCNSGIIQFNDSASQNMQIIGDIFNVKVGIVPGKKKIFQNDQLGNVYINTSNGTKKFIWIKSFPTENIELNNHLLHYKDELLARKCAKFTEHNWFSWMTRNQKFMESNKGKACIYVPMISRNETPFFKGTVDYFDGSLLCLLPKSNINIDEWIKKLNDKKFMNQYNFSGRCKFSQGNLSKSVI